jgi:hypothetical protein
MHPVFFKEGSASLIVFIPLRSVWDGYIIPHKITASPTNKIFNTLMVHEATATYVNPRSKRLHSKQELHLAFRTNYNNSFMIE